MNWTITDIENLTEKEVNEKLENEKFEHGNFCGIPYNIYLVDFGGYFGYSKLVFWNNRHLYHLNDYELHHPGKGKEELKKWYMDSLKNIFSFADFSSCADYQEKELKDHFIRNEIGQMFDSISIFFIGTDAEREKRNKERIENGYTYYSNICFCYFKDSYPVELAKKLIDSLDNSINKDSFDYWENAFLHEMYNHEYAINWQADFDVLVCFGNVTWCGENENALNQYFNQCNFNDMQKKAYISARNKYFENANY